ncbi:hypothetical protein Tco_1492609 [Tanacetum coccineum]
MAAFLKKLEGSAGFHQIVDFLNSTHIKYALTKNPTIYVSLIHQFWQTASASTSKNEEMEITVTIDGRVKIVTEAYIRRHLKLEDSDGISTLPNTEIFEQLALMGAMLVQPQDEASSTSPLKNNIFTILVIPSHNIQLKHNELMELVIESSDMVVAVEEDLKQTKKAYGIAFTKLVLKVNKLEQQVRSGKARRRARIDKGTSWFQEDVETQDKNSEKEVSTADVPVSTDGAKVSTGTHDVSTAAAT